MDVNREVAEAVSRAVRVLEDLGAHITETDPGFAEPLAAFGHLFYGGAANAMRSFGPKKRALMDPQLVKVAEKAAQRSMLDYMDAANERLAISERMALFHQRYDLLVTPTLPITAFAAGREVPEDWHSTRWPTWTPFSYPFNITGCPCGFRRSADRSAVRRRPLRRRAGAAGRACLSAGGAADRAAPGFLRAGGFAVTGAQPWQ